MLCFCLMLMRCSLLGLFWVASFIKVSSKRPWYNLMPWCFNCNILNIMLTWSRQKKETYAWNTQANKTYEGDRIGKKISSEKRYTFSSSQQHRRPSLVPLKDFLSWYSALKGPQPRLLGCFWNLFRLSGEEKVQRKKATTGANFLFVCFWKKHTVMGPKIGP